MTLITDSTKTFTYASLILDPPERDLAQYMLVLAYRISVGS